MSRNETDHYIYPLTQESLTRVTSILDSTDGKQRFLVPWCERVTAESSIDSLDMLKAVLSGRAMSIATRESGRDAAIGLARGRAGQLRDLKADTGSYVHSVVEALILWQASPEGCGADLVIPVLPTALAGADYDGLPVEDVADIMLTGFLNFTSGWKPVFHYAEMTVYNYGLGVAGTLDMIVDLPGVALSPTGMFVPGDGERVCIDVKTGGHLDGPIWQEQVAAYRRMTEADPSRFGDLVPMPATGCGAVLHLRPEHPDGYRLMPVKPADDAAAWNRFRRDVEIYRGRKSVRAKPGKVCRPPRADGTIPAPRISDLDGEGYGNALAPLIKAGIADLEQLAAMDAGDCLKVKGIAGKLLDVVRTMLADHGLHLRGEAPADLKAVA